MSLRKGLIQFLLYITGIFTGFLNGQTIQWSDPVDHKIRDFKPEILGASNNGFWTLLKNQDKRENIIISAYSDLNLKASLKIQFQKNQRFLKGFKLKNKIMLLYFNRKDKMNLKADLYNLNLDTVAIGKSLTKLPFKRLSVGFEKEGDSLISILALNAKLAKNSELTAKFLSINYNLKVASETVYKLKLGNKHNIHGLKTVSHLSGALLQNAEKNNFQFVKLNSANGNYAISDLSSENKFTRQASLVLDKVNKQFLVNGLYYMDKKNRAKGISFFKAPIKDSSKLTFSPFPKNILQDIYGSNTTKSSLRNFKIRAIIPRSDGGTLFLLEEYYQDQHFYHDYGYFGATESIMREYFYFEKIAIIALSPEGKIQWHKIHHKKQTTVNDDGAFSSFASFIQKNQIILLYNTFTGNHQNLLYYTLGPKGKMEGDILINGRVEKARAIPKKAEQISHDTALVPAIKEEHVYFIKITF